MLPRQTDCRQLEATYVLLGATQQILRACLVVCSFAVALEGCSKPPNSGNQADDAFLKNADFPKERLAKFSGKVTVDGQPPKNDCTLFVILTIPNTSTKMRTAFAEVLCLVRSRREFRL